MPTQKLLDFRIAKQFRFGGDRRFEVVADFLNLLDDDAAQTLITQNFFSPNFDKPATHIDPRRAMFGVKFVF